MTFKLTLKNIGLFAFIWLNIGFALGLTVLIGPVRWVATYSRENNYSDTREGLLVKGIILLFVAVSFLISLLLSSGALKAKSRYIRILIPVTCLVLGGLALYQLLNPQNLKSFANQEKDTENKQFVFGSYPTKEELEGLKREGYTAVISLLHPAVTPFEPVLLKEEEENCIKAGLTLISVPMLPWISKNEDALKKLQQLAQHSEGKYYVHCYLGKDRVNVVKRLIASYNKSVKVDAAETKARSIESKTEFERGKITKISKDVYYTPYPTDEEYTSYVIGGGIQQVVSLMDSTDNEQKPRIDAEKALLETYQIPFTTFAIQPGSEKQLVKLKEMIAAMPKPLVIHRFFTNTKEDLAIIEALRN